MNKQLNDSELNCNSVKVTLEAIGGKWKPLILWLLREDTLRFSELQRGLKSVTQKMLTQELRELESDGIIIRKVYPVVPPKVEYTMTDYGKSLLPILKSMHEWGEDHQQNTVNQV